MKLFKLQSNNNEKILILNDLKIATSFLERLIGLMGKKNLEASQALWIHQCNSVQTCFMKFNIDIVFVDENLIIKHIIYDMKPWRISKIIWNTNSAFEFNSKYNIARSLKIGDQLYVGT